MFKTLVLLLSLSIPLAGCDLLKYIATGGSKDCPEYADGKCR